MTPSVPRPTVRIPVDHPGAVQVSADRARALARECGLPGALPDHAAVLAGELATNIDKHARDGAIYLQPSPRGNGLDIVAVDRGPGIADIPLSSTDGRTTPRALGAGLGTVLRTATDVTLRSAPGYGTLVHAWLADPPGEQHPVTVGGLCLPATGEEVSGDGYAVSRHDGVWTGLVLDGLGHGPEAATATRRAVRTFRAHPHLPPAELLTALHEALRHSRGAAATVVRVHPGYVEHCGIGNIRVVMCSREGIAQQFTGQPGIVGYNMPTPRTQQLEPAATVLVHTDGIDHRWTRDVPPAHLCLPPTLLAASLLHSHRRHRDDATALVLGGLPQGRS
ncbi:SpoIIE family protein phosphatase [Streptomyces sp. NPDC058685]|uniref:SpoIIE family protein phosphatase n=1 Tax=Streptomyces sp. NPDC058685 TaxID=3346598 RepID=UPI00364B010E